MAALIGAGTIVYLKSGEADINPLILIGDESVAEFRPITVAGVPTFDPPSITMGGVETTAAAIQSFAGANTDAGRMAARRDFHRKARDIEGVRGYRIQFSQPVFTEDRWTTQFRKLPAGFRTGIPKGHREGAETAFANASREMSEETGTGMRADRARPFPEFDFLQYRIFRYPLVDGEEKARIEGKIADRMAERYSELFNPRFRRLSDILDAHEDAGLRLNRISEVSLLRFSANLRGMEYHMPARGGRRNTRQKQGRKGRNSRKGRKSRRI